MKHLTNIVSTYEGNVDQLINKYQLDGIELIMANTILPENLEKSVVGWHLPFWPDWIDFFTGNNKRLEETLPTPVCVHHYYGCREPGKLLVRLASEMIMAEKAGAEYMVIHVSNNTLNETISMNFSKDPRYSDKGVCISFVKALNATIQTAKSIGFKCTPKIYLENLWWPGMTYLRPDLVTYILDNVDYPNLGLCMDTAHLINTNPDLSCEDHAIDYILDVIENLGDLKSRFGLIHLTNVDYTNRQSRFKSFTMPRNPKNMKEYQALSNFAFTRVSMIDPHLPFTNFRVKEVVYQLKPDYLVHELNNKDDIAIQRRVL